MIDFTKDIVFVQDYCFNTIITEYDIQSAGLSILKSRNLLSPQQISELENMPKTNRNIAIGMLIRDNPSYQQILKNAFIECRKRFITENELNESDIICIKKDAIFTTRRCDRLEFDGIVFRDKTKWRSYMKLGSIEFFYKNTHNYQVLNLGTVAIDFHKEGWIKTIIGVMDKISNADRSVKQNINGLVMGYKEKTLPDRFYNVFKSNPVDVDPMYNFKNVLIPLMQIVSSINI